MPRHRSSAAWRTCQSRSSRARCDGGPNVVAVERGEGEDGAPPHGRLVLARGEDRREPRASPIAPSAAAHDSRTSGSVACVVNSISRPRTASLDHLALAARPGRDLDHRRRRRQRGAGAARRRDAMRPVRRRGGGRSRPGRRSPPSGRMRSAVPSRSSAPSAAIRTLASVLARPAVAVAGSDECPAIDDLAPARPGHRRPITSCTSPLEQARQPDDRPRHAERHDGGGDGARDDGEPAARERRERPGGWARDAGRAVPGRGRRGSAAARAPIGPRGCRAFALAGLRHPARTRAPTARPAIHAAWAVSPSTESARVTDTQEQTIAAPGPIDPRAAVRLPTSRHRWWSIPMVAVAFVACTAIGVGRVCCRPSSSPTR